MTAISRKAKENIYKKLKNVNNYDGIKAVLCFFAGICGGRSIWCDIPAAGLVPVMARCTDDMLYRYCIIAGGLLSCGLKAVADTVYIPYFLSYIFFAVVANVTSKEKYPLASSLAVMAAAKIFLTYFSYPFTYKLLAIAEAAILYFVAQVAKNGAEGLADSADMSSFTDALSAVVALSVAVISLSGLDSHALYPGRSAALALGWFYISGSRPATAFVSFLSLSVALLDKQGFIYLYIAFARLWLLGGFCAEKLSLSIYPAALLTAFGINVAVISNVNSFVITGSTITALIIYTALPHIMGMKMPRPVDTFADGRDWRLLMSSMKKLENSLNFLAGCVIDISRLNEKNLRVENVEDLVAEDVCRKCEKNTFCWQEKYSYTQQRLADYGRRMYWAGENRFPRGFMAQCSHIDRLAVSFEENSRLLLSKKYILQSQKNNQKLLQNAFLSISAAVGDLIYQNRHSQLINTTVTMSTDRFLKEQGINPTYCLCSQNPDQTSFAVLQPVEEKQLYRIQNFLESAYGTKFSPPAVEQQGTELLYIFSARPLYSYEMAVKTSRLKNVNGDNYDSFVHGGKLYILLSDGMGTGSLAAAESRTVIEMARSLITTGVSMKNVVNIINLSLNLKGSGENSASLDIMETDLFTGNTTIVKAGAGVSLVIDKKGVTRHYADSLPLGILKDIKPVECSFTLLAGDTAVVMSDGAGVVSNDIKNMYSNSPQEIAGHIIDANHMKDDKTVIAIRLKIAI